MCAAPQIEMYPEEKIGDISTARRRDSHTHRDRDLNFPRPTPGNAQVRSRRDDQLATQLASYCVCVAPRAGTCPPPNLLCFSQQTVGSGAASGRLRCTRRTFR